MERAPHAAVQAYRKTWPAGDHCVDVERLKGRVGAKTVAYRLHVTGGNRSRSLIAKGTSCKKEWTEKRLYEEVLSQLPVDTPRLYGSTVSRKYQWLFLEDVGENRPSLDQHGLLLTEWIATMHGAASRRPWLAEMVPDRGYRYYRRENERVRELVSQLLNGEVPDLVPKPSLKTIQAQSEKLDSIWPSIASCCRHLPRTLIHGDWVVKNIRLVSSAGRMTVKPFDWELAGWGVPAADLSTVSPSVYQEHIQSVWPECTFQTIERLQALGRLFRYISATHWELMWWIASPAHCYPQRRGHLEKYADRLTSTARRLERFLLSH